MSRTPEDQKALDAIAAARERGEDPFGDDEELVRPGADGTAPDGDEAVDTTTDDAPAGEAGTPEEQAAAEAAAAAAAKTDDLDPLDLADIANPPAGEQPTRYDAAVPTDYKEQRTKLLGEKATAMKQLMDGEIEAEAYAAIEDRITGQLDDLTAQRIRAETLQEANVQNQATYNAREVKKLIARTKDEINYQTDSAAPKEFDRALGLLLADPENAGRDYAEVLNDAHRMVMAMRGLKAKPAPAVVDPDAAKAAADANRKPGGPAPTTLRNLPSASVSNTGGGVIEQMAHLKGPEYQAAFAKLTPQQRATLLDEA